MNGAAEIAVYPAVVTATLLIGGAVIALVGSLGLLKFQSFYERAHAPTLGTTLGTACVALASMIYFSMLATRPVLHEVLIVIFITVTTPISLMVLIRAAVFRDSSANQVPCCKQRGWPHR
jgi:multicomponent K+:H+ antiporter subunit G